jgi:hypothetical protein
MTIITRSDVVAASRGREVKPKEEDEEAERLEKRIRRKREECSFQLLIMLQCRHALYRNNVTPLYHPLRSTRHRMVKNT